MPHLRLFTVNFYLLREQLKGKISQLTESITIFHSYLNLK